MKKTIILIIIFILIIIMISGCNNKNSSRIDTLINTHENTLNSESTISDGGASSFLMMPDREGIPLRVDIATERIICFVPSATKIYTMIGMSDKLLAIGPDCDDVDSAMQNERIIKLDSVSSVQIIELNPDLIIISSDMSNYSEINILRDKSYRISAIPPAETVDDVKKDVMFLSCLVWINDRITGIGLGNELVKNEVLLNELIDEVYPGIR